MLLGWVGAKRRNWRTRGCRSLTTSCRTARPARASPERRKSRSSCRRPRWPTRSGRTTWSRSPIESVKFIAANIAPETVPDKPRVELARHDAWTLSVHPGWRGLWIELVTKRAVGSEEGASDFGMNTAGPVQVGKLFDLVGVVAFDGVEDKKPELDRLVGDRGTIVHTARPPSGEFRKADATGWRQFVEGLYSAFDESLLRQAEALVGSPPW